MRSPTLASAAVTPAPTATTTPHGSCPAMTGSELAGMPVPVRGRFFGRRYWCSSDPHMPEAFISSTTSPGPGVGSGKVMISTARAPGNTTPRMASSVCYLLRRNLPRFVASPYPEISNKLRQRHPCEMRGSQAWQEPGKIGICGRPSGRRLELCRWRDDSARLQQRHEIFHRQRLGEEVALHFAATPGLDEAQLLGGLDALGDDIDPEFTGEPDGRLHDRCAACRGTRRRAEFQDEILRDLDAIHRELAQVVERGKTCSKIVDRQSDAACAQPQEKLVVGGRRGHQKRFRDLQLEHAWREAIRRQG